jgi:hypothetical protein
MLPSPLEQYLDRLEQPLAALPRDVRSEWREEARQHLLHLIAAYEELGTPADEAVLAAIRQFGDPDRIGANLERPTLTLTRRQPSRTDESRFFRRAVDLLLGLTLIENSCALFFAPFMLGPAFVLLVPALLGLSFFLFRWFCLRGVTATQALLWTTLAAAGWPWSTLVLLASLQSFKLAWLLGPLLSYAIIAGVGLTKHWPESAT